MPPKSAAIAVQGTTPRASCNPARTRTRIAVAATVILALAAAADAHAQVSAGAAIGIAYQGEGADDSPYLGPPFGGTSPAGIAMIDGAVSRRVSLGAEVSLAADVSGTQNQRASGGNNHFVSAHHDTVFSAVLKFGSPASDRVRAAVVGGGGIAQRHTDRSGTFGTSFAVAPITRPFEETVTDYVWALTAGVDVAAAITGRVAILIAGRFHQLKDDDRQPDGVVNRGVSSRCLRAGAGVQIRF
jgi:opacity protein-like surface antigen